MKKNNGDNLEGTIKLRIRIMPEYTKIKFGYLGKGPQRFEHRFMEYMLDEIKFNTRHLSIIEGGSILENNLYLKNRIIHEIEYITRNFMNSYNDRAEIKI